jgi:cysteine synthase A
MASTKDFSNKHKGTYMRVDHIYQAIGHTTLVKLNRLVAPDDATVYVKLESLNPGGSVKDRIGAAMIENAERDGKLKPGMTIIEPTSGNTGIGLAMVSASKGYKCILTMPETMSLERRALLRQYGAELILTPGSEGMRGAIKKAEELASQPGFFMPMQFNNPANPEIHRKTTAMEIIEDLDDLNLDAYISGVGTGGTVSGGGQILKSKYHCKVIAVEPDDSAVLSGGSPAPHPIQGIGAGFIPANFDSSVVDQIIRVKNRDAFDTAKELAKKEGILAGISSGANVWAALQTAQILGKGKIIVTFICDTGERYLSTKLFSE